MIDPWIVLGVPPGSSTSEIRAAYRRLLHEVHPDHGGDPAEFRRVHAAAVACLLETTTTAEGEPADGDGWPLSLPAPQPSLWTRRVEPVLDAAFALAGIAVFLGLAYLLAVFALTLVLIVVHEVITVVLRSVAPG